MALQGKTGPAERQGVRRLRLRSEADTGAMLQGMEIGGESEVQELNGSREGGRGRVVGGESGSFCVYCIIYHNKIRGKIGSQDSESLKCRTFTVSFRVAEKLFGSEENYELWRGGTKSKREVAGIVVQFLEANGLKVQDAHGINKLESKYCNAANWRAQTGQGIEDNMEADVAQFSNESESSNIACLWQEEFKKIVILGQASRDQTAPEDRENLGDIFTSNGRAMNHTDNESLPPAEDINNNKWPYSPTQELPEGQYHHALGAIFEHADVTTKSQKSACKRILTLDEDDELEDQ
ncbi:uncharacterized protein VP01_227g5 [Puccinia sorghi]|uniref:Uncharacterized protein n=1 Tax=Puccinia sorghi TaxID=27349 RepID=A0A0L6V870_9BASI|nr:uncharacterized protein VP01_227g5 [Puccinia sorghi]